MSQLQILVPVDFDAPSAAAAQYACDLAEKLRGRVHLLHVYEPVVSAGAAGYGHIDADGLYRQATTRLRQLAENLSLHGGLVDQGVVMGRPVVAILDIVDSMRPDLVVIGAHERRAWQRAWLGSVAESIVKAAACSVVVVKSA